VYLAGLVLQTNMGSMCVQFSALIAPNQDIAFVLAAGACVCLVVLCWCVSSVGVCGVGGACHQTSQPANQPTNQPTNQPFDTTNRRAGYVAASILTGGFIVSFPEFFHYAKCATWFMIVVWMLWGTGLLLSVVIVRDLTCRADSQDPPLPTPLTRPFRCHARWLQWTSFIKFTFQPLAMNALRGTSIESVIDTLAINTPPSISANLLCGLLIYVSLTLGAYLALRHLHKEKRWSLFVWAVL
jgi:hypothetical protein